MSKVRSLLAMATMMASMADINNAREIEHIARTKPIINYWERKLCKSSKTLKTCYKNYWHNPKLQACENYTKRN